MSMHKICGRLGSLSKCSNVVAITVWFFLISSCVGEASYSPPNIPIKVSIDTRGNIRLALAPQFATSIGTFDLDISAESSIEDIAKSREETRQAVVDLRQTQELRNKRLLIVRVDDKVTVFELEEGIEFRIEYENDDTPYRKVDFTQEADGDLVLELESVNTIYISNHLELDVKVSIDGDDQGVVKSNSMKRFVMSNDPVRVDWEVVHITNGSGDIVGNELSAHWLGVEPGSQLDIDNLVGDIPFFFPIVSNNTDYDCEISVNDGLEEEYRPGMIEGKKTNVVMGYHHLYSDSNVSLYCENGAVYWWGLRPAEKSGVSFFEKVSVNSGVIKLALEPHHVASYPVPVAAPQTSSIRVVNLLHLPARISIDNVYRGTVSAQSEETYVMENNQARLDWEIVKETTNEGTPIGDDMSGFWESVNTGETIHLDSIVGNERYFYPLVTNNSRYECEFSINDGWENENRPGANVPENAQEVGLGYYRLSVNSNVTLYCADSIHWWGMRPKDEGSRGSSFLSYVPSQSGVAKFVLSP